MRGDGLHGHRSAVPAARDAPAHDDRAGVNVVALVDDSSGGVKVASTSFLDTTYNGKEGSLWGTFVDFSGWHSTSEVGAYYGNFVDGAGTNVTLVQPLVKPPMSPALVVDSLLGYENVGIRFDAWSGGHAFDRFGQSFDSIAFVSNATLTPPAFYGVRENFVFALAGIRTIPRACRTAAGVTPRSTGADCTSSPSPTRRRT